jgi:hypothetical protein
MAIQIKSLGKNTLQTSEGDLYTVPLNKTAIVKSIRLVNTGGAPATVNLFVRRSTTGTSYRIAPKDMSLAPGAAYVDDSEITLEGLTTTNGEDRVRGVVNSGATVDYVISGVERDV